MVTDRLYLGFHWRDFPETSSSHIPRMRCDHCKFGFYQSKPQCVASFLPVGGVSGAGGRAYWALWNGEGWVFYFFGTSIWRSLLYFRSGGRTLDQTWRCISDSLLTYRSKVLPAKILHVTVTPWSRFLPENLTCTQLVKKLTTFYGIRMFFTAFTSSRQLFLSWVRAIQFMTTIPLLADPF